jgi:predicted ATPase
MLADSPERTQRELALQLTLGELLMAAQGMASADAGEAHIRAHALCQQAGETPQLFRVLSGLFVFHNAQARLCTGREFGGGRPSCIGSKGYYSSNSRS